MPIFNGGRIGSNNVPFTGTKSNDPNYSSVSLLLNGNGIDGSTTFTDNSSYGHTVTPGGDTQISTTQRKFGGASMYFDGSGDYLSIPDDIPDDTSLHLGSDNFTFEFWTYLNSTNGNFINKRVNTSANVQYLYFFMSGGSLVLYATSNGSSWDIASNFNFGNTTLSTGQWYHIALVRSGTEIATYVNGIKSPNTITTSAAIHNGSTNPLRIAGDVPYNSYLNGYIDDFRLTQGVARYTSNFTPPTAQLPGGETGTFASGLWTGLEQCDAVRRGIWPVSIVADGLVLHLDAGNSNSYPGYGTTWYDLSDNGNNGTLMNGPTYNSSDGGSIVFDGDNDYVDLGTIGVSHPLQLNNGFTISWWGIQGGGGDLFQRIIDKSNGGLGANGWAIYPKDQDTPESELTLSYNGTDGTINSSTSLSSTSWQNWSLTWSSSSNQWIWYLNGSVDNSGYTTYGVPTVETNARIGSWNHSTGREYKGKISSVLIYTRPLTSSEITQNFDALKGRYGL